MKPKYKTLAEYAEKRLKAVVEGNGYYSDRPRFWYKCPECHNYKIWNDCKFCPMCGIELVWGGEDPAGQKYNRCSGSPVQDEKRDRDERAKKGEAPPGVKYISATCAACEKPISFITSKPYRGEWYCLKCSNGNPQPKKEEPSTCGNFEHSEYTSWCLACGKKRKYEEAAINDWQHPSRIGTGTIYKKPQPKEKPSRTIKLAAIALQKEKYEGVQKYDIEQDDNCMQAAILAFLDTELPKYLNPMITLNVPPEEVEKFLKTNNP